MTTLLWSGAAAAGLVWGWLLGLKSAPLRHSAPPTGLLSRRSRRLEALRQACRALLWLVYILAPAAGVYLVSGPRPLLLFLAMMGLALWLHRAWLEQLRSRFRNPVSGER
jgi:hypothetical protein